MQQQFSSGEPQPLVNLAENSSMIQARIDAYLNRTCAPLFLSLTHEEATQQRAEMQSHLDSLVTAHIELGYSEIEAVTLTLEQFGKEQSVAQAWKLECEETKVEAGRGTFWSAIRPIAGYSTLNWIVFPMLLELYSFLENGYSRSGGRMPNFLVWIALFVFLGQYSLFPAFLGYLVGRRARGKVLVASLVSLPLIVALTGSIAFAIYGRFGLFLPPKGYETTSEPPSSALILYGVYFCFGALGAVAGRSRRRKALRLAGNR